ncbi:putative eukaryotic translation initiation factor subunit [Phaeomoniella chlamydospora]|uniref:Eukaryotic translation initiation factor 2A n=1 Tax=Phaeomoniella chlamydospora TaxID=158046 RepID=A0A0G2GNS2_PHACM|nr:putative eukaryotic translation initiation factor subunit [Phaeomoniella chlamydospora]
MSRSPGLIGQKAIFDVVLTLRMVDTLLGQQPTVNIIDASVGHIVTTLPTENVYELGFSPKGTFIITWQRPSKDENTGEAVKNLKVWRAIEEPGFDDSERQTGQPAAVKIFNVPQENPVSQKSFFKGDKVQLKWNEDGSSLIVLAQTDVDKTGKSYYGETTLYLLSANGGFDSRIDLDKEGPIHDVSWSPSSKEFGVVYGTTPAKTTIFNVRAKPVHSFPLNPRNTILFSPHGRFVLVAGFGNYAGHMDIYDLEKDYAKVCTIQAANTSVCEWSPDGKFILTATTSPRLRVDNGIRIWHVAGGLMYNEEHHELYHVCWRPQSSVQHPLGNPFSPLPTPHASALKYLETVKTPSKPAGAYRPPGARGQVTPLAYKREDEGGAAYVRAEGVSSFSANINGFGKPRRREIPGAESVDEQQSQPLPPGAAPGGGVSLSQDGDQQLSKAAAKNKKKREAKKAKEAAEKSGQATPELQVPAKSQGPSRSPDRKNHERSRSKGQLSADKRTRSRSTGQRPRGNTQGQSGQPQSNGHPATPKHPPGLPIHTKPTTVTAPPPEIEVASPTGGGPQDKKIRGLLKKIRAIDDLKMRLAGGEKLEDTQIKKIQSEDSVRKELQAAGYTDTA